MKRRHDASKRRIGNLIFAATQRRSWAAFARKEGRNGEAEAHEKKFKSFSATLKTLGYDGEI